MIVIQLGLGHTNHVREPTVVTVLQGKQIHQISAGRCHSTGWTAPSLPPRAPGSTHTYKKNVYIMQLVFTSGGLPHLLMLVCLVFNVP